MKDHHTWLLLGIALILAGGIGVVMHLTGPVSKLLKSTFTAPGVFGIHWAEQRYLFYSLGTAGLGVLVAFGSFLSKKED